MIKWRKLFIIMEKREHTQDGFLSWCWWTFDALLRLRKKRRSHLSKPGLVFKKSALLLEEKKTTHLSWYYQHRNQNFCGTFSFFHLNSIIYWSHSQRTNPIVVVLRACFAKQICLYYSGFINVTYGFWVCERITWSAACVFIYKVLKELSLRQRTFQVSVNQM